MGPRLAGSELRALHPGRSKARRRGLRLLRGVLVLRVDGLAADGPRGSPREPPLALPSVRSPRLLERGRGERHSHRGRARGDSRRTRRRSGPRSGLALAPRRPPGRRVGRVRRSHSQKPRPFRAGRPRAHPSSIRLARRRRLRPLERREPRESRDCSRSFVAPRARPRSDVPRGGRFPAAGGIRTEAPPERGPSSRARERDDDPLLESGSLPRRRARRRHGSRFLSERLSSFRGDVRRFRRDRGGDLPAHRFPVRRERIRDTRPIRARPSGAALRSYRPRFLSGTGSDPLARLWPRLRGGGAAAFASRSSARRGLRQRPHHPSAGGFGPEPPSGRVDRGPPGRRGRSGSVS